MNSVKTVSNISPGHSWVYGRDTRIEIVHRECNSMIEFGKCCKHMSKHMVYMFLYDFLKNNILLICAIFEIFK